MSRRNRRNGAHNRTDANGNRSACAISLRTATSPAGPDSITETRSAASSRTTSLPSKTPGDSRPARSIVTNRISGPLDAAHVITHSRAALAGCVVCSLAHGITAIALISIR
jgi:hypothetical protein